MLKLTPLWSNPLKNMRFSQQIGGLNSKQWGFRPAKASEGETHWNFIKPVGTWGADLKTDMGISPEKPGA